MATITAVADRNAVNGAIIVTWEAMGDADTGTLMALPFAADITVQVAGTFGSATVVLQGSNDGSNWATLGSEVGTNTSFTSAGIRKVHENPAFIRAVTSGGTGTDVDVIVAVHARYQKVSY